MISRFALLLLVVPLLAPAVAGDPPSDPVMPPTPPMNVEVSPGAGEVTITWDPPLFFGGADEVTYRVYKGSALIADGLDVTNYVDPTSAGSEAAVASYYVTAVNNAGESAQSGYCIHGLFVEPEECKQLVLDSVFWVIGQIPP